MMEPGQAIQLAHILERVSVGVAILNSTNLHIRYANPYILALLDDPWSTQAVVGRHVADVLPAAIYNIARPILHEVAHHGQTIYYAEVPYEGSLETRGRTYWNITIQHPHPLRTTAQEQPPELLITVEDVTETVRSRLHLHAIHSISSAIAGPSALPLVLDRILQALQELVGAYRCAVLLIGTPAADARNSDEETSHIRRATMAAKKGIHPLSQDWQPLVNRKLLLGKVIREKQTLVFTNTNTIPHIDLPFLDDDGQPCRPGSVLCVPIFEPYPASGENAAINSDKIDSMPPTTDTVLGTIEVYHRRPRGFPAEEVELLQRFAQQAGLAIQNARLFRSIDHLARTARRNARQKDNVVQAIPDAVLIFDPRWRIADTNSAARRLFGWSGDIIGLTLKQAIGQSSAHLPPQLAKMPNLVAFLEQRALDGRIDEIKVVAADSQSYTLSCSYTPIRDEVGDTFAFIIIFHDVTKPAEARERIEAEVVIRTAQLAQRNKALQEAKAAQELLLERMPSGVILVSAQDNTITVINRRAVQILQSMGLSLLPMPPLTAYDDPDTVVQQAIGLNSETLLRSLTTYGKSENVVPFEEQPLYRALKYGEASEAELHSTKIDGRPIHLLVNSAPLRAPDGTTSSAILVLHEISRMKALERAREDFFTTMAHELKTPLANIRAHLSALLADDLQWSGEARHDLLETADEQVERLVAMVNSFLDASRVEAGALRLELEAILLPELLEDLQDRLEALITSSHRHLQIILSDHLPAVQGDYEMIISVLTNLLSNAFRYAPEGEIVQVEARSLFNNTEEQPFAVMLSVSDPGPGMSQERQTELFTRFSTFTASRRPATDLPGQPVTQRRRGSSRWSPATGLGLYISRGIIEAHGSTLTLQSSPGQGAIFSFTLPTFIGKQEQTGTEITP